MFPEGGARVFALPCGADFPAELVRGLQERLRAAPPEAMARVRLYVNTARMQRRIEAEFLQAGAHFLPRIRLVSALGADIGLPAPTSPLRRRLELATAVGRLLDAAPDLAPRAHLYDLADSLALLMDEMQGEGVRPEAIAALDVSEHSDHWARTQAFLGILAPYFEAEGRTDAASLQREAVALLARRWQARAPDGPVIVAGSTGSRGTTALFMRLVARLPQGALVLPGFDFDAPEAVWQAMGDAMTAEDHPQFRYRRLMDDLGIAAPQIARWTPRPPPAPARNRLISLSLRPAPVTDRWLVEGPELADLPFATQDMALIEAPSLQAEAMAIALILRAAVEAGTTAALITPDRTLTRQVAAELDRWGILPDDSAGRPLALSAPGRFLRHVAGLIGARPRADQLLVVLKHPLTASGGDRGRHLLFTRDLELKLRKSGPAFPTAEALIAWAATRRDPGAPAWAAWLAGVLADLAALKAGPLCGLVAAHRALAERLAQGAALGGAGGLWEKEAGLAALALMEDLARESPHGGAFTPEEYGDLLAELLNRGEVREPVQAHPGLMIWGTLEARVQGAELVILGGLNDGVWPGAPAPDPWLNRQMRKAAGLLLPERQIGLSAHDYQQAVAAPRVVLSRALRSAEAETVPSRWLNRLVNLMSGLPGAPQGPEALAAMRGRGAHWLALAATLAEPTEAMRRDPRLQPAPRPQPQPPPEVRPARLSLTNIARLIRDPYAIYARHILRLYPLDPLRAAPDARERGLAFHEILERFVRARPPAETRAAARTRLLATAAAVLAEDTPFPAARALWRARMERAASHFLAEDQRSGGTTLTLETAGAVALTPLPFTLYGTPDRIDRLPDGTLHLIDYKTGAPPTKAQQQSFDKQLLLAAAMAERGGFAELGQSAVSLISYIGLGAGEKAEHSAITPEITAAVWSGLGRLIARYGARETGYTARRAVFEDRLNGDYDHLARYGEWQMSDHARPTPVGEDAP